jgi:hypothetical protein
MTKDKTDELVRQLDYARRRESVEPELAKRIREKAWEELRKEGERVRAETQEP